MYHKVIQLGRSGLALAVLSSALVLPAATGRSSADAVGWQGLSVSQLASSHQNPVPGWGIAVTEDLGGSGADIWNNNHGNMSEAVVDLGTAATVRTALSYGSGITNGPDSHGAAFSDIDGDGDEDLYEAAGRNNDNRLFRNDSGTLVSVDAGNLKDNLGRGRQPLFLDFDGDGDMDVINTNLDRRDIDGVFRPSELYLNNGDGTSWTKVADPNQIMSDGHIRMASMTSTSPGSPQIVVTHDVFSLAKDSIAVGTGVFAEPSNPATRHNTPNRPIREVIVGDFDGDLHPEFIAFMGNASVGGFDMNLSAFEVSAAGSARTISLPQTSAVHNCRSGAAADFDNDGDLDILAGCSQKQEGQDRNVLLLNDGLGNFSDAGTGVLPTTIAETASAIVTADVNADGWMDAIVANGYDAESAVDHVLTNQKGTSAHWLEIDLIGSNPDAAGAQVFVGSTKWQVRETGHRYHRSQDARTLHFGLGAASQIAKIEIRWPDGIYQSCTVSGIDRRVTIVKGSNSCQSQTRAGLLAALAAAPDTSPGTPPPPPVATCAGVPVTVNFAKGERPTNGNDVILGTMSANLINALDGDDLICALGGNDIIIGGNGKDIIYAGAGNDEIRGGPQADRIRGGPGNDIVRGGEGWDWLFGNGGRDQIFGGNGVDRLRGGPGIDKLDGGPMRDYCAGGQKANCELRH